MVNKIVFFISARSTGDGGHFYSLVTTARALQDRYNVHIITIGKHSPVIEEAGLPCSFIPSSFHDHLSVTIKMVKLLRRLNPDVIHFFDYSSYLMGIFAIYICRIPVALTKCGGPINKNFPYVNNLIVYTKEDYNYFLSVISEKETQLALIPNRVLPFSQDERRIESLKKEFYLEGRRVILRIGRFGGYLCTAIQCIKMVKALHELDDRFVLVLIGVNNEENVEKLRLEAGGVDYIHIVTDDKYTLNAKALIDVAEIVVGTGRGFMEACFMDKLIMAPNKGQNFPELISEDNFQNIFYYNFSERYTNNKKIMTEVLLNKINNNKLHSRKWFDEYFSFERINPLYTEFYANLRSTNHNKLIWNNCWKSIRFGLSNVNWLKRLFKK